MGFWGKQGVLAEPLLAWESLPARPLDGLGAVWPAPSQDLYDERLLITTVQSKAAYEQLWSGQQLTQSWDRVDPDFLPAYQWMAQRMERRGIPIADHAPLWAWARLPVDRLTTELSLGNGDEAVLIVAEVPSERCLRSVHDAWHHVMNRTWCPAPGGREDAYEQFEDDVSRLLGTTMWWFEELPEPLRRKVMASWRWCEAVSLYPEDLSVQVALPWLHAHEVVAATRISV